MKLIIEDEEGRKTVVPFVREEISIGRQEGNTIRLTERNVSRKHARLLRKNGSVLVEDLGSFNGVKVNGDRIEGKLPVQEGDLIEIGDYDLAIENEATDAPPPAAAQARDDGRGTTEPSGVDGRAPTPVSGRAPTAPGRPNEMGGAEEEDAEAGPPRSQSTAVIRTGALNSQAREVRDLAPEERPKVVIVTSDQAGQEAVLEKSEFRIGRTTGDNDLAINHRSISRNHAKLVLDADGNWHVLDLQSANGVRVNGEDYADAPIASGDLVELGHVKLRFVGAGESYHYTPEDERTPTRRSSSSGFTPEQMKQYGMIGGGVAVVVIGLGLYFALGNKSPTPPKIERHPSTQIASATPAPHPTLPLPPSPAAAANPPTPAPTPAPTPPTAAPVAPPPEEPVVEKHSPRHAAPKEPKPKAHKASAPAGEAGDDSGEDSGAKADKHAKAAQTVQEAVSLMNSSDYRGAAVKLQRALALDPNMADAHKALGICYAKLQEPDKGAAHYEAYIKLKPNAPDAARVKEMLKAYYQSRGQ